MDVKRCGSIAAVLALLAGGGASAEPVPAEVTFPLQDYLSLVETVERVERQRAEELARQETPVADVISQRVTVAVGDTEAEIAADFEVLLGGKVLRPVLLPLGGFPEKIEIRDEAGRTGTASVSALNGGGGVVLAAPQPGRYTIHVDGRASLGTGSGTGRLSLGRVTAPVASTEIDLPADLAWSSPGAVVVEEREEKGRRRVRLTTARGADTVLDVRRKVDSAEAEKLLAQSVVLTILQLRPEGLRRHDVVLYEVRRGSLGRFTVALPPGLEIEQAGTDEGTVVPVVETGRLTIHRKRQLQGVGYLVLSSTPPSLPAAGLPLVAVQPEPEVRARYLAISSVIAADVRPLPEASWTRVDTSDLPAVLSEALAALDLAAAWRLSADGADTRLAVAPLPSAPMLDATIRRRDSTALMTVDGTLLFRDRFLVDARSKAGAALDVMLPAGGTLWSVKVDDQAVRPLVRGGTVSVPLGFNSGRQAEVEVVSVLEKALPPGRSQLALDLPRVAAPVLVHRLRLLLPEGASYRVRRSDLRSAAAGSSSPASPRYYDFDSFTEMTDSGSLPAGRCTLYVQVVDEQGSPLPGSTVTLQNQFGVRVAVADEQGVAVLNVAGGTYSIKTELEGFSAQEYPNLNLRDGSRPGLTVTLSSAVEDVITVQAEPRLLPDGRQLNAKRDKVPAARDANAALFKEEAAGLQQGLVGGVKPLPVSIPESGKALAFSGVLPPSRVTVELDVKAKGKS